MRFLLTLTLAALIFVPIAYTWPTDPPVVQPSVQVSRQAFCVTTNRGVSYIDLTVGGFNQGTYWRSLYETNQTVMVAGQTITFRNTGPTGIQPARLVVGIGSTC